MVKVGEPKKNFFSGKLHPGFWVIGVSLLTAAVHNALTLTGRHSLIIPLAVGGVLGSFLYAYTKKHRQHVRGLHQTGAQVRRSEEKYRAFFENSTDAMLILEDDEFVDCNEAAVAMLGYDRKEEIIHMHPSRLSPEFQPDDRPSAEKADEMIRLAEEQGSLRFEWDHLRKDGTVFPVEVSLTAIRSDGGTQLHTVWRDMTERKQADEAREHAHTFLQEVIDGLPEELMVINRDYTIALANRIARGVAGEDPVSGGLTCHQVSHLSESPCVNGEHPCPLSEVVETRKPVTVEHSHRDMQGRDIIVEVVAAPIFDETGEVIQIIESSRDITKRKRAEEALLASMQRLALHVKQTPLGVIGWDLGFKVTEWNPAAERIFGYTQEEALGQHARFIVPPAAHGRIDDIWEQLTQKTGGFRSDNENITKEGQTIVCEWYNTPLVDTRNRVVGVASFVMDITDRKQAEEERKTLELQLRRSQKMEAIGQLAGGIAHDFNNLLQVICGYAELLRMDLSPENPIAMSIEEIDKAAKRGKKLVSQLLAFGRRQVMQPVSLNLSEVVDPLLNMVRGLIGEHIRLNFIPGHALGMVWADRGLMEQVLMNLCVNARDAMPHGGTLTIETENVLIDSEYAQTHSWAAEGRCILLSVSDTGTGMDQKTLERIFEPFFTTKDIGKGTGLGLSMAYGIIKQHKGQISAYSEPGKGTIFKIYLPAVEYRAAEISSVVSGPVSGGTETLLVAEDDNAVLSLLERTLCEAGYTVLTAKDGKEAVRIFKEHAAEINMLMFDVVMPRMGGKEAMEEILKTHPDLPHLFASGYSENAVHTDFIQNRGLHLLSKPYQTDALLRKIREVLEAGQKTED